MQAYFQNTKNVFICPHLNGLDHMETATKQVSVQEREKMQLDMYRQQIKDLLDFQQRCKAEANRPRLSLAEEDSYLEEANHAMEKAIKTAFDGAESLTVPMFKSVLFSRTINLIRGYYDLNEPGKAFRVEHPFMATRLMNAYSGFLESTEAWIANEKNGDVKKRMTANMVRVEDLQKKISFVNLKRN
jgi:hypothetical protein